jgi:glycosyltransferase involved in cell wall biosynthesis
MPGSDSPPAPPVGRGAFVSWLPFSGRSQGFIDALGLAPVYVSYLRQQDVLSAVVKYGPQFVTTLRRLARAKPDVVFVMNPPVFAVLATSLYCRITGARYVVDCHSGVFESSKWRWSLPLQRFLGRRAAAVIVTNQPHQKAVASWPARAIVIGDPRPRLPTQADDLVPRPGEQRYVFVILTFGADEAVPHVLQAARRLPQVRFRLSGDPRRASSSWLRDLPANVELTGFVPLQTFWENVRGASAILTLTTRPNTILQGGWEAMFMARPLITSASATLREYFTGGTVFVDNSPTGIAAGVEEALSREPELAAAMGRLRDEKALAWRRSRAELENLLGITFPGPPPT